MEEEGANYEERASRLQREAHVAMGEFLASAPDGLRRSMLNLDSIKSKSLQARLRDSKGAEFRELVASLPPERLRRLFLVEPKSSGDVGLESDVAESPGASYTIDIAGEVDDLADELAEEFRFNDRTAAGVALFVENTVREQAERYNAWLLCKIIIRLAAAENCKIAAAAAAFAVGVRRVWVNGKLYSNQLAAAKPLACTRSNLCKAVRSAADFFGIDRGIHLKPPAAVAAFKRATTKKTHWRKRIYGR